MFHSSLLSPPFPISSVLHDSLCCHPHSSCTHPFLYSTLLIYLHWIPSFQVPTASQLLPWNPLCHHILILFSDLLLSLSCNSRFNTCLPLILSYSVNLVIPFSLQTPCEHTLWRRVRIGSQPPSCFLSNGRNLKAKNVPILLCHWDFKREPRFTK